MIQRKVACVLHLNDEFLFADIPLHTGIAAPEAELVSQTVIDALYRMALLPWYLPVCFQPLVDRGDILAQYRIVLWLNIRETVIAPVRLVSVFFDGLEAVACSSGDFPQTYLFIFVEVFDILYLSHS
jgi:hypothetical protein